MLDRPTALETVTLVAGDARVFLAPARGGMATRFFVGDRAVFYLDEATLLDPAKNVRGGNPVLFPSPGKLAGDQFERDGRRGKLGQHGFARNAAWEVVSKTTSEAVLRLSADEATRAVYPWDFVATYTYRLERTEREAVLRIEQHFATTSETPVPFGAGFHPYFAVQDASKASARIPTGATRAWDNATKREIPIAGPLDLTGAEVDLHLVDHDACSAALELGDGSRIEVRASDHFRAWVVWTLRGKDFVCLEPWSGPANALNSGEGLLLVHAGEPLVLSTEIAFRGQPAETAQS